MAAMQSDKQAVPSLLVIIELGGYPNFSPLYKKVGYEVTTVNSVRKALALLKHSGFDMIIAEFNFQSDFRDRTSSLESLLAVVQRSPDTKVIVFYEPEQRHQLERLLAQSHIFETLAFPLDEQALELSLQRALMALPQV